MQNNTPLRYPGGKSRITVFISKIIKDNNIVDGNYVEPFAGGCGVALNLLLSGIVKDIYINDKDRSIYAFWYSILNNCDEFIEKINSVDISVEEWKKQQKIQKNKEDCDLFELGFSTFFLNRTNRSGIIKGGIIGGLHQNGAWKLDVRFNKEKLIDKILKIVKYKENIHLYNLDAVEFLDAIVPKLDIANTLFYLDPPYYVKGGQLYMNYFKHEDHIRILNVVKKLKHHWLVSYDNHKEINELYDGIKNITYLLRYTAGTKYNGSEIMFASSDLIFDENAEPLKVK